MSREGLWLFDPEVDVGADAAADGDGTAEVVNTPVDVDPVVAVVALGVVVAGSVYVVGADVVVEPASPVGASDGWLFLACPQFITSEPLPETALVTIVLLS